VHPSSQPPNAVLSVLIRCSSASITANSRSPPSQMSPRLPQGLDLQAEPRSFLASDWQPTVWVDHTGLLLPRTQGCFPIIYLSICLSSRTSAVMERSRPVLTREPQVASEHLKCGQCGRGAHWAVVSRPGHCGVETAPLWSTGAQERPGWSLPSHSQTIARKGPQVTWKATPRTPRKRELSVTSYWLARR
jgi:hypothetical protein